MREASTSAPNANAWPDGGLAGRRQSACYVYCSECVTKRGPFFSSPSLVLPERQTGPV